MEQKAREGSIFSGSIMLPRKSGGRSYAGFVQNIRKDALANATEQERKMISAWKPMVVNNPFKNLPKVKGPGKAWSVDEDSSQAG